jgi:LCP family protein required for cell wall assembly
LRKRRRRVLLWSLVGLIVVIAAAAGGSYLWLNSLVSGSHPDDPQISTALSSPAGAFDPPTGMNIILIGSDNRNESTDEKGRSDTVMLVHADPEQNYLSVLSLPRDLRVEIPGRGMDKLNAAYAFGGPVLTIETVKQLTGMVIDEYVEVDFNAFNDITDALGGVYVDVDRRYYNDDPTWALIKLSPGYQLLDGSQALGYVRFRHDLNMDFGRMDRQQRFLDALREQALGWNLPLKLPGLVRALFGNLKTTLGTTEVIDLAAWGVRLGGDRIRQLSIIGDIQTLDDGVSYVVPAEGAVEEAIRQLTTAPAAAGSDQTTASGGSTGSVSSTGITTSTSVTSTPTATDPGQITGSRMWELAAASMPFQVMAPSYLPPGYDYVDRQPVTGGGYEIDPGKTGKPAFKVVYRLTREGEVTDQYLGIMETTWLDAPAASKGQELKSNGITYTFVGTNLRTDRIWWKQNGVLYWVSNTLSFYLSKKELLKVAESMIVVPAGATP